MSRIYVCESCIEDPDLQKVIREQAISEECDYCGRSDSRPISCDLSVVLERIRFVINQNYADPNEFMFWDSREGGWQGQTVYDGGEIFEAIGWEVANESLMEDIRGAFCDDQFADEDYWPGPEHERHMTSWERFKEVVKHERRYTFWSLDDDPELGLAEIAPNEILKAIVMTVKGVNLVREQSVGSAFWRVRVHSKDRSVSQASDFSTPPRECAVYPNRMSPSGIPLFYGADDFDTAQVETVDMDNADDKMVTGGRFLSLVPLKLLDLTAIPELGGYFSEETKSYREAVKFLKAFRSDISSSVEKDGGEHTEYVPTQVFTEFVRYELPLLTKEPIHGIKYPSSKNGRGCYVLFVDQMRCLPPHHDDGGLQILEFDPSSLRMTPCVPEDE